MARFPSLKQPLTLEQIKTFRENFEITFAEELNGPDWHGYYTTYSIPDFDLAWKNETEHNAVKNEFTNYSFSLIGERNPKKIDLKLLEIEQQASKNPAGLYKTTPSKEVIERGTKLAEEQAIQSIKSRAFAETQTQKFVEGLRRRKITVIPVEEIPTVKLSEKERESVFNLAQAVNTDPATTQEIIEKKTRESIGQSSTEIKDGITDLVIKRASSEIIEKVKPFAIFEKSSDIPKVIPVLNAISPLIAISDPNNPNLIKLVNDSKIRESLTQNTKGLSIALETENNLNHSLALSLFDGSENISGLFYPQQITQFQIAKGQEEEKDNGVEINLEDVYDQGSRVWDFWQKISNRSTTVDAVVSSNIPLVPIYSPSINLSITTKASSLTLKALPATIKSVAEFGESFLAARWFAQNSMTFVSPGVAGLLTSGGMQQIVAVSSPVIIKSSLAFISNTGRFAFAVATGETAAGTPIFAIGAKLGQSTISAAVGSTGTRIAVSGTLAQIGAALGSWAPVIGTIIGAVVGWIAGKVIQPILNWIKKHQEDLKILGLLMLGGGALMQSIPLLVFGGLIFIPTAIRTGFSLTAIGARTAFLLGRIGSSMAITIATPIVVMIIVFPILVAIILFIINSGAYIVPPKMGSGVVRAGCSAESAKIAGRAKLINNNLRLGFNNYYNNSPDYPELWNSALYSKNPNPVNQEQSDIGATDMFWCNYMATKSFLEAGINIPFPLPSMVEYFQKQPGKWVDGATATPDSVCPGDTIYFKIPANSSGLAHVAIVYDVSSDGVTTVESNAPYKTMFYPVDENGRFQVIGSGNDTIKIVGFGTP